MELSVALSANAGVALNMDGHRIWVDALHEGKEPGFSTLTPQLQRRMMSCRDFAHPEYICYTHCHGDHYSEKLTYAAGQLWPNARILAPEGPFAFSSVHAVRNGELDLRFCPLPHEGAQYADVSHFGLRICLKGKNILIAGDCAVAHRALLEAAGKEQIHLLLLTFPWITLPKGREFLRSHFPGVPVIAYHLPFEEDDCNGYRAAAKRAGYPNTHLLLEPLQKLTLEI